MTSESQFATKFFYIYKTYDFKWSNRSYTSMATSLFKQMCGHLPESLYNVNARQTLKWCTTDDIPDDEVSIDICRSYLNILINNTQPIPLYSIHDVIEPFKCENDLRQRDEFYIDETVLDNYELPLIIEAGFYSSNLIL